jgi:hypothetical protein
MPPRLHPVDVAPLPLDLARLLHRLRLRYVRLAGPAILARAQEEGWDHAHLLKVLFAEGAAGRDRATREAHRKAARLPSGKTFDAWDPKASAIPGEAQWALRTLDWIGRAENLVLVGPSGTGKSHFAEAIRPRRDRPRPAGQLVQPRGSDGDDPPLADRRVDRQGRRSDRPLGADRRRRHRTAPGRG